MTYCAGCNTHWVATGCGYGLSTEADWHARCPHPCAICHKPITGRKEPDACAGHTLAEHDILLARLHRRVTP